MSLFKKLVPDKRSPLTLDTPFSPPPRFGWLKGLKASRRIKKACCSMPPIGSLNTVVVEIILGSREVPGIGVDTERRKEISKRGSVGAETESGVASAGGVLA